MRAASLFIRKTVTTCEVAKYFRVPYRTALGWFAAQNIRYPRLRGGWTKNTVHKLEREIKANRKLLNTGQVARLLGVNRDTLSADWPSRGFKLPSRVHLIGTGKGRTIKWRPEDIERARRWYGAYYRKKTK